jgi:hypothetical protein
MLARAAAEALFPNFEADIFALCSVLFSLPSAATLIFRFVSSECFLPKRAVEIFAIMFGSAKADLSAEIALAA